MTRRSGAFEDEIVGLGFTREVDVFSADGELWELLHELLALHHDILLVRSVIDILEPLL